MRKDSHETQNYSKDVTSNYLRTADFIEKSYVRVCNNEECMD